MCGKRLYHSDRCAAGNRDGIAIHRPHPGLQEQSGNLVFPPPIGHRQSQIEVSRFPPQQLDYAALPKQRKGCRTDQLSLALIQRSVSAARSVSPVVSSLSRSSHCSCLVFRASLCRLHRRAVPLPRRASYATTRCFHRPGALLVVLAPFQLVAARCLLRTAHLPAKASIACAEARQATRCLQPTQL
jgi:hypothetical protein